MPSPKVHRKGKWEYGRRVKSSGVPSKKGKKKVWFETPEDRAANARRKS